MSILIAETYQDDVKKTPVFDSFSVIRSRAINRPAIKLQTEVNPISNKKRQSHHP